MFLLAFTMCSCSSEEKALVQKSKVEESSATAEAIETKREAVFASTPNYLQGEEISLKFNADPTPFKEGYIRLAGIVRGPHPIVCLEISGKGALYSIGDQVDRFCISKVLEKEVILCQKK